MGCKVSPMSTNDQKRFRIRTNEVNLADDGALRWVSLLPEGRINAHGTVWDLSAAKTEPEKLRFKFDDVVSSLEDWLAEFAPPIAVAVSYTHLTLPTKRIV